MKENEGKKELQTFDEGEFKRGGRRRRGEEKR
jgi:hypothetical protein